MVDAALHASPAKRERKRREVRGRVVLTLKPWWKDCVDKLAAEQGIPVAQLCRVLVLEALGKRGFKAHELKAEYDKGERARLVEWYRKQADELEEELNPNK